MFPFHGQLSIYRLKSDYDDHEHQVPVSPSKQPQNKQCRESNTNISEPLYSGAMQCRQRFSSSIMGQTLTVGNNQSKPTHVIKNPSPHFSLYSHLWSILF